MRRLAVASLAAASLAIGFGGAASAADLYVKAPIAPPPTWAGFYGGANAGWVGSADNTIDLTGTDTGSFGLGGALASGIIPPNINLGYSGFLGGGQLGYNWQRGSWVFGLEGDLDWVSAKSSIVVPDARVNFPVGIQQPLTVNASRELDWLGTVRGRIGYTPTAPLLLYATGGLAVGQHQVGIGVSDPIAIPPLNASVQSSTTSVGWTVGAGVEWMFAQHWSLKAEYLYVDLGNVSSTLNYAYVSGGVAQSSSLTATAHDTDNIVRGGINYHF